VGTVGAVDPRCRGQACSPRQRREIVGGDEAGELLRSRSRRDGGVITRLPRQPLACLTLTAGSARATWPVAADDGNYRIVGRSKELIIRRGREISIPPEIEEYLLPPPPGVAEVAIVGLPDARPTARRSPPGSSPSPAPTSELTISAPIARGRSAHFKIPKYVGGRRPAPPDRDGQGPQTRFCGEQGIERFGLADVGATPTALMSDRLDDYCRSRYCGPIPHRRKGIGPQ